jgi:hypothetical protein
MATYKILGGDSKEYGPVTPEQLREWVAQGRANGSTLVWTEGGVWKKLSSYPEFADVLPQVPASAPPPPPLGGATAAPPSMPVGGLVRDAKSLVQGPAIGLMILGLLALPSSLGNMAMGVAGMRQSLPPGAVPPEFEHFIQFLHGTLGLASNLLELAFGALILIGGLRMMSLRNYGLCMAAAILAIIPCTNACCCIGLPLGIWAVVVLSKPEVKSAFM